MTDARAELNGKRAARAFDTIDRYATHDEHGARQTALADLLADLMHAEQSTDNTDDPIDFDRALDTAIEHFNRENTWGPCPWLPCGAPDCATYGPLNVADCVRRPLASPAPTADDYVEQERDEDAGDTLASLAAWMDAQADEIRNTPAEDGDTVSALVECARQVRRVASLESDRLATIAQLVSLVTDHEHNGMMHDALSGACDGVEWISTHLEGWGIEIPFAIDDPESEDYIFEYKDGRRVTSTGEDVTDND